MTTTSERLVSPKHDSDLRRAVDILKDAGCKRVFMFGSHANGTANATSDIDLAIEGCPQGQFFRLLSHLYMELDTLVDLINLDNKQDPFVRHLLSGEELVPLV